MVEKIVDTNAYVSVLRELAEEGRVVSMQIAGSSMSPFCATAGTTSISPGRRKN